VGPKTEKEGVPSLEKKELAQSPQRQTSRGGRIETTPVKKGRRNSLERLKSASGRGEENWLKGKGEDPVCRKAVGGTRKNGISRHKEDHSLKNGEYIF